MLTFTVNGIPRPQPRPRAFRGVIVATADPRARQWSDLIMKAALRAGQMPKTAISVSMHFRFPTKKDERHGKPHLNTPDADNLAKLALDAIQRAKTIVNDSLVAELHVVKTWERHAPPGACFTIREYQTGAPGLPEAPAWITETDTSASATGDSSEPSPQS